MRVRIMPRFCPTCGNSSDKVAFLGNFCIDCAKKKFGESLDKKVEILWCRKCGRIKSGKSLVYEDINGRSLESAMRQHFHRYSGCHLIDYTDKTARLDISEETSHGKISVEHEVEIEVKKKMCDICYKRACNYHEAVMQLRGNRSKIERFVEKLTRYVEMNNGFITKVEEKDGGLDIYLSSKSIASAFVSKLRLHPNMSYTLAGVKGGKQVYKNTYAIRYD